MITNERPHTPTPDTTTGAPTVAPRRGRGAHRASRTTTLVVALTAAVAVVAVLLTALATSAATAGSADAAPRHGNTAVVGRVCGPGQPPAGWIVYRGSNGDRGAVRTGRGWYSLDLRRVGRGGEWVSGTAYCPGHRPWHRVRSVPFGFFVPRAPVVHRTIR